MHPPAHGAYHLTVLSFSLLLLHLAPTNSFTASPGVPAVNTVRAALLQRDRILFWRQGAVLLSLRRRPSRFQVQGQRKGGGDGARMEHSWFNKAVLVRVMGQHKGAA